MGYKNIIRGSYLENIKQEIDRLNFNVMCMRSRGQPIDMFSVTDTRSYTQAERKMKDEYVGY